MAPTAELLGRAECLRRSERAHLVQEALLVALAVAVILQAHGGSPRLTASSRGCQVDGLTGGPYRGGTP
jgi:hypothetical protein